MPIIDDEKNLNKDPKSLFKRLTIGLGIRLGMIVGACVFAFLMAELGLRIAGIGRDQFLRPDSVLGVRFIESKAGLNQAECFRVNVSTNSHGWRNSEVSLSKSEGVYRVLVLGDSNMAALQVEDDETFPSVLESRLNSEGLPRRVEVINLGVPSFGTDQEYLSLRDYGLSLMPDLVLLAFYAQNDVMNNYSALEREGSKYPKPFFDVEDGKLVELEFIDPTPTVIAHGRRLAAPFRLYLWGRDFLLQIPIAHQLLYKLGIVGFAPRQEQSASSQESTVWRWPGRWKEQTAVYRRDYSDKWMHAWAITERLIVKIRGEAERAGAEFLLVGISDPIAVLPEPLLRDLVTGDGVNMLDVDKPTKLLRKFSRENGIDFISLVQAFRDRIGDSETALAKYYLSCDGHWTRAGHQLAAELAVPDIAARIASASR